jgi:hypothetical protein
VEGRKVVIGVGGFMDVWMMTYWWLNDGLIMV